MVRESIIGLACVYQGGVKIGTSVMQTLIGFYLAFTTARVAADQGGVIRRRSGRRSRYALHIIPQTPHNHCFSDSLPSRRVHTLGVQAYVALYTFRLYTK